MDARLWRVVRWFVALGVCAVVVVLAVPMAIDAITGSIVFDDEGTDEDLDDDEGGAGTDPTEPTGEVPTGSVGDGDAAAEADFVVREGVVEQADSETLVLVGGDGVAVVVLPLVDGSPECVASAELQMQLESAGPTEIGLYAATVHRGLEDGQEVDAPRLDDTPRALAATDGSPGRLVWDVTDVYRSWATGQLAPAGTPFAVVLDAREELIEVVFSALEAGPDAAPVLSWEGEPGCAEEV